MNNLEDKALLYEILTELDVLDESTLSPDQMINTISMILDKKPQQIPHPSVDWDGFVASIENSNNSLPSVWNPSTKEIQASSNTGSATNKSFVIDHPTDHNKYLVHVCLEGPEAGVYYRGEGYTELYDKQHNKFYTIVHLPTYVDKFATNFTVQITPIAKNIADKYPNTITSKVDNNMFYVSSDVECGFYWTVFGMRNSIVVEPKKGERNLKAFGPYTYLE
jgi:predicted nucleic-acid-binding Zn-ribbon protein